MALSSTSQKLRTSEPDIQQPEYSGSAFDTCISEPGPSTGLGNGLDAINTLLSELSDVESLTVLSPRSGSDDLRGGDAHEATRQRVHCKQFSTLSDYSKHLKPIRTTSSQAVGTLSSVSADLHVGSSSAALVRGSKKYRSKRLCSADLYALPKLACAPLLSEMNGSVMLSDDDANEVGSVPVGREPVPSKEPTIHNSDSICGTFRPISSQTAARPASCNLTASAAPAVAPEDSAYSPTDPSQLPSQTAISDRLVDTSSRLKGAGQSTSAVNQPGATDMEAIIMRMGAAVGSMSALARPDSGSSMVSAVPEVKQRQQAMLLHFVEAFESFLQPPAACGPVDSDMASVHPDTSHIPSRHMASSMKGSNFSLGLPPHLRAARPSMHASLHHPIHTTLATPHTSQLRRNCPAYVILHCPACTTAVVHSRRLYHS